MDGWTDDDNNSFSSQCRYQSLNLEDRAVLNTGRKAAVKEKECTDKAGLELGCVQED